jgi:hypothetical protein
MIQKIKSVNWICLTALMLIIASCKKDKLKEPLVQTNPSALYIYGRTGDVVSVSIDVYSDIALSRFYVTAKIDNSFQTTTLDSAIDSKDFSINYEYKIPANAAGKSIIFTYNAVDADGNKGADIKRLIVEADTAIVLVETSGHQLFSAKSNNSKDAYDLETNTVKWSMISDSTERDIQDYVFANDTSDALSLNWVSPAHGKFVRFNGFDYANATDVTVINSYASGAKLDILSNIQLNDIIITKLGSVAAEKYVLIKITGITDAPGKEFDSYTFSIKK